MYITRDAKYVAIIGSIGGIITFISLYLVLANTLGFDGHENQNIGLFTAMIFVMIIVLAIVVVLSVISIIKEKENMKLNLNYAAQPATTSEYVPCPRCGSNNLEKVDYSWWGGFLGPRLVHQVRCRSCGKAYDGVTGKFITKNIVIYSVIVTVIMVLLLILRILL